MTYRVNTVTIPSGSSQSTVLFADGLRLIAVVTPSAMTGTTLTLHGGVDEATTRAMYDDVGSPLQLSAVANAYINVQWLEARAPYLRLASNVNEAATRTLTLVFAEEV